MVEPIACFATFVIVLSLGAASLTASLSLAVAELLRYGEPAWFDAG